MLIRHLFAFLWCKCKFSVAFNKVIPFSYIIIPHVNVAGFLNHIHSVDFFKIAILACFCAIHNHGLQTLLLFSAIVRHISCPPVGFSILRAGLIKPVRLSGYSPRSSESQGTHGTTLVNIDYIVLPYHFILLYKILILLRLIPILLLLDLFKLLI